MHPIHRLLADDHDRLDALLARAERGPGGIDLEAYAAFRAGLARHIGMEEKILFPAARRRAAGVTLPDLDRLRADHGRLVSLLVLSPTPPIIAQIRAILVPHNKLEEDRGGVYDACERLLGAEAAEVAVRLAAAPAVPMRPYHDGLRGQGGAHAAAKSG